VESQVLPHIAAGHMKYPVAWIPGVPGGLIVLWFLFNHVH
jgi:hypothetical protein